MSETQNSTQLQRKLSARHLNMIAIGGSIGTGLFLASGATIANAGPGGALLAYALIGVMIYFLMTSLGEKAGLARRRRRAWFAPSCESSMFSHQLAK